MRDKMLSLYVGSKIRIRKFKEDTVMPFLRNERGDIVQTGIIIGILAILAFVVLSMLREPIKGVFDRIKEQLDNTKDFGG